MAAVGHYVATCYTSEDAVEVHSFLAMFTWLKVIPTLDAQHGTAGRGKHLGENETGMTALQEFKDEENIRNLAYEAVDALVELMDREKFDFWMNGIKKKAINRLLIQNKETFDEYSISEVTGFSWCLFL